MEVKINLENLYKLQEELDNHILEKHDLGMSKDERLQKTVLAMIVELGEFANSTRCFKHWSTKGMMEREVVLDELADVWHFYLSIGNQMSVEYKSKSIEFKTPTARRNETLTLLITNAIRDTSNLVLGNDAFKYMLVGNTLEMISKCLNFSREEVEEAYLKKHEVNYRRQKEGY